jgi:C-terminal processing protease CtpA/Prc
MANSVRLLGRLGGLQTTILSVLAVCGSLAFCADPRPGPANLDFEEGQLGKVPTGWFMPAPSEKAGFSAKLSENQPKSGKRCVRIESSRTDRGGVGILMQSFDATPYRGKRVRYRAAVRTQVVGFGNQAQLWLRVDRKNNQPGFFDNMIDRPIGAERWQDYEIVGDVDQDAESISIGIMVVGNGRAWLDAASFQILGPAGLGDEPARPLQGRELDNLVAFTRLLGYVRYFHPSDQAAAADWDQIAIEGVLACLAAKDASDLAQILKKTFKPVAPTLRVFRTGENPPLPAELQPPFKEQPLPKAIAWLHLGVGTGNPQSIYSSRRVHDTDAEFLSLAEKLHLPNFPDPAKPYQADLGGGVSCLVPLALLTDAQGTIPHTPPGAKPVTSKKPEGFLPSGKDRATRLAAVSLAWNVFQHFYPYFDVVKSDWPGVLRRALTAAAIDTDDRDFLVTLRRLVAELHDGHGNVVSRSVPTVAMPPFLWDWIENQLVITKVAPTGAGNLKPGEVVVRVNGLPAAKAVAQVEQTISSATPQWLRYRALLVLAAGPKDSDLTLDVQPASGDPYMITVKRTANYGDIKEPRPDKVAEIKPGIWYLDLDRILDEDFNAALPKLEKARGIIFDLRGYPHGSTVAISHLTDKPVTCAQWHVPVTQYPDHTHMSYSFSNWKVPPLKPHFQAKVTFVTDGRAISYAETYLGIIEHYKLADIVGAATAGTNGNVNPFRLPGGYRVMWTGMRVLKHDGSQHHGVGVQPTLPAARTIRGIRDGRDELLSKALEVVEARP